MQPIEAEVLRQLYFRQQEAVAAKLRATALASIFDAMVIETAIEARVDLKEWEVDLGAGTMIRRGAENQEE